MAMETDQPPPEEDEPGGGEWPPKPSPSGYPSGNKPNYGNDTYKQDNPFGGSRPEY